MSRQSNPDGGAGEQVRQIDFFNTVALVGERLRVAKIRAGTQQDVIAKFFLEHPELAITPFEVQRRVLPRAPITSVRRALTNLTTAGVLRKCELKEERYGYPNHVWRLGA